MAAPRSQSPEEGAPAVSPAIERVLTLLAGQTPRADILEPFVEAARDVVAAELASDVTPGPISLARSSDTTLDVTVVIGLTGKLTGIVVFALPEAVALEIVSKMLSSTVTELDDLAISGIAELGNVITGRAATLLAERGMHTTIAPPVVLLGAGSRLSTGNIPRLVIPFGSDLGSFQVQLAIKVTEQRAK